MYFKSKKISLLILGATAIVCSRTMLVSFDDPEGPNLLIVMVMAGIVYFLSLSVYVFNYPTTGLKRLLLAIFVQIVTVTALFAILS
jgi:hypothetical protein